MKLGVSLVGVALAMGMCDEARAQEWVVAAQGNVASGVDVGGKDLTMKRARTVVSLGAELSVDERPKDIWAGSLMVEVEPKTSFGGSLRYMRMLAPKSGVFLGGQGFLAPDTLFGASGGFVQHVALSQKTQITVGPAFNVFFIGQDVPDDTVFWQGLLEVGFRADL